MSRIADVRVRDRWAAATARSCLVAALVGAAPASAVDVVPAGCETAQYEVFAERLKTRLGIRPRTALVLGADGVSVPDFCPAVAPRRFKANRKGVVALKAVWDACEGLTGRARFAGRIVDGCSRAVGTVKAKRFKWKVQASRSAFRDVVLDGRTIAGLPGGAVTLDGSLRVDASGEATGDVVATYGAGGTARVVSGPGFLAVEVGGAVVDLLPGDDRFVRVEAPPAAPTVLDVEVVLAAAEQAIGGGGDPATWDPASQAILVLAALASTPEWTANVQAAVQGQTGGIAPAALGSVSTVACKTGAIAAGFVSGVLVGGVCLAPCVTTIEIPVLGVITCEGLAAICGAAGSAGFAAAYEVALGLCGERLDQPAPTSRVRIASAAGGGPVVAGGAGRDIEISWQERDPMSPPAQPLTALVETPACPLGLVCPSGSVTTASSGSLVLPAATWCSGTLSAPTPFEIDVFLRETNGIESERVSFSVTCLPGCTDAAAPLCGGGCEGAGQVCRPSASGVCACLPGDAPPCGTVAGACSGGRCPIGQHCARAALGCGCVGDADPGGGGAVPGDLPPGTYALSYSVTGAFGPIEVARFRLSDPDEFRRSLTRAFDDIAATYQTSQCSTDVGSTPFNGTLFTVTFRITCQDDEGVITVTELIFEVRKVA